MDAYSVSSVHYSSPSQTYGGTIGTGPSAPGTAAPKSATVKKRTPRASMDGGPGIPSSSAGAGSSGGGGVVATASAALNSISGVGTRHMSPLNPRRGKEAASPGAGSGGGGGGGNVGVSIGGAVASMNPNVNSVGVRSTSPVQPGRRRLLGVGRRAGQS